MVILLRANVVNKDRGQKVNKSTIKVLHVTSEANRSKFKMKNVGIQLLLHCKLIGNVLKALDQI